MIKFRVFKEKKHCFVVYIEVRAIKRRRDYEEASDFKIIYDMQ